MYLASPRTSSSWTPTNNPLRVEKVLQVLLRVLRTQISFTGFKRKLYGHGIQSFLLCFEHCAEHYLCPYYRLLCGFEPVRCPTYYPNDRALRRHIYSIPPHYISNPKPLFIFYIIHGGLKIVVSPGAKGSTNMAGIGTQAGLESHVE
jgi:hypothetical protein